MNLGVFAVLGAEKKEPPLWFSPPHVRRANDAARGAPLVVPMLFLGGFE